MTSSKRYLPSLVDFRDIRLFHFKHSHPDGTLQCTLRTYSFHPDVPLEWAAHIDLENEHAKTFRSDHNQDRKAYSLPAPDYTAVSYMWGDNRPTHTIMVNDIAVSVGASCWDVLSRLHNLPFQYFWMDALCIDQDNDEEKSHQVQRMGQIYQSASRVLACPPPPWFYHEPDRVTYYEAIAFVQKQIKLHPESSLGDVARCWSIRWDGGSWMRRIKVPSMYDWPLASLITSKYWSRLWIIQELVLARTVDVLCDHTLLPLPVLAHIWLKATNRYQEEPEAEFFKRIVMTPRGLLSPEAAFSRFRAFECANPLDRVYGLAYLIEWPKELGPIRTDYTISTCTLASRVLPYVKPVEIPTICEMLELDLEVSSCPMPRVRATSMAAGHWQIVAPDRDLDSKNTND